MLAALKLSVATAHSAVGVLCAHLLHSSANKRCIITLLCFCPSCFQQLCATLTPVGSAFTYRSCFPSFSLLRLQFPWCTSKRADRGRPCYCSGHLAERCKKVRGALLPPAWLLATDVFWCSDSVCCLPEVSRVLDTTKYGYQFWHTIGLALPRVFLFRQVGSSSISHPV